MLNRDIFSQIGLDSGALSLLGTVIHQLDKPGSYRLSVQQESQEMADTTIQVGDDVEALQVTIDLSKVGSTGDTCGCHDSSESHRMRPGGHVVFHVGEGRNRYAAVLAHLAKQPELAFDSRELRDGDRFVATVLRPGRYTVTNVLSGARGRLEVSYPEIGKERYRPPEPVEVTVTPRTLRPASLVTKPGQAVIYTARAAARITIDLEEPFDREAEPRYKHKVSGRRA